MCHWQRFVLDDVWPQTQSWSMILHATSEMLWHQHKLFILIIIPLQKGHVSPPIRWNTCIFHFLGVICPFKMNSLTAVRSPITCDKRKCGIYLTRRNQSDAVGKSGADWRKGSNHRGIHFELQKERLNASWDRRSYNSLTLLSIIKRTKVFRLSPTYSQLQQSRHGWWPLDTISGHLMQADINNEAVMPLWAAGVNSQRVWESCSCSAL